MIPNAAVIPIPFPSIPLRTTALLGLKEKLRIETQEIAGRLYTRAFIGSRELRLSIGLLSALTSLSVGRLPDDVGLRELLSAGVLQNLPSEHDLPRQIALDPCAVLDFVPQPQRHRGHSVIPEASLPIGLMIPPELLDALQRLSAQLRLAYRHMANAALSRQQLVPIPQALHVLFALCQEAFASSPALFQAFDLQLHPFALTPKIPLQTQTIQYPLRVVRMLADRQQESQGKAHHSLTLRNVEGPSTDADLTMIKSCAELLLMLDQGCETETLLRRLPQLDPAARTLFHSLMMEGMLIPPSSERTQLTLPSGTVMHLGHATLLGNLGGAHILIDPWFPAASRSDSERPLAYSQLPPLAAIFITHHHWDHVHIPTLMRIDRSTPIYIPHQDLEKPLVPRTDLLLEQLGFARVHTLTPGQSVSIGDGGSVYAAPFYGEDPTRLGYKGCCYVLVQQGQAALVHVDSGPDLSGLSTVTSGTGAALRSQFGALSPVFATRRQERGIMIEHTWEFLLADPAQWLLPTENCCTGAQFLADLCRCVGAPLLALYSEGGADFYPDGTDFLRRPKPSARTLPHEFLWDDLGTISAAVLRSGARIHMSAPYHCFRIGGGFIGSLSPHGGTPLPVD